MFCGKNIETNLKTRGIMLCNYLRFKETNGIHYLNTPKSEQFLCKEIPPFTQDLAYATTEMESLTQNKISAKLIGVQNASKNKIFRVRHASGTSQI